MSNPITHPTVIWATLLCGGEGGSFSLPEDDPALEYAEQMQGTGLLVCTGEREWTLSSRGMQTLTIVDSLRDLSLSRL